mgnify:CR=1 FL=1
MYNITILNLIQHADVRINGIEYHPEYFNVFLQNLTNDKSKLIFSDKIIIYNKNTLCKRTENSLEPVEQFTRIYNEYTYLIDNEINFDIIFEVPSSNLLVKLIKDGLVEKVEE